MIVDIDRFIRQAEGDWRELEDMLRLYRRDVGHRFSYGDSQRMYYLYRKASHDLVQLQNMALEGPSVYYLQGLLGEAYAELYGHGPRARMSWRGVAKAFAQVAISFRRQGKSFFVSFTLMLLGALVGCGLLLADRASKEVVLPFPHLLGDPADRVAMEETVAEEGSADGMHVTFSAQLMANNIRVSVLCLALGLTLGVGTGILLFYNGVILGMVALDYMLAGQTMFLLGWLLPHGSVEIPAILIAGQSGVLIGRSLLPGSLPLSFAQRFHLVRQDLAWLFVGIVGLLIWAGLVESFFSQYHAPVIAYEVKIAFGAVQLLLLAVYLGVAGRRYE